MPADVRATQYPRLSAMPPSRVYRLSRFVRRHRLGVTAGVAMVLALLLLIAPLPAAAFETEARAAIVMNTSNRPEGHPPTLLFRRIARR